MRQPAHSNFIVIMMVALCASVGVATTRAWADDPRIEARTHYQAGVKFYGGGDYKAAIKEFSSAQQLAPADLNNYNLALCYDKLGDAEPAIQYYKEYLAKVPDAPKRSEIEASVSRLEGALKSSAAKRAEEAKKADDARAAEDAKHAQAAQDAKKADDARHVDDSKQTPPDVGATVGGVGGIGGIAVGAGSTGTPSTGQTVSTGDAQLDRVSSIDISSIRDQRMGAGASGMPDTRGGPAIQGPNGPNGMNGPNGPNGGLNPAVGTAGAAAGANGPQPPQTAGVQPTDKPVPAQETPLYKKWWFWAVVAVSAYVVYEIATQGSQNESTVGREVPLNSPGRNLASSGLTLFHF